MLRRRKFSRVETWLIWLIALGLLGAGGIGLSPGVARSDWKIAVAGAGLIALATIYLIAAVRRRPL